MNRRMWVAALLMATMVAVSSCASLSPDALPQPGKAFSGGYDILIEFDNVLNLPRRAKVVMGGVEVGVVTNVAVASHKVDVTARIAAGVSVPTNVRASLQQATLLGDIFLTLDRPVGEAPGALLTQNSTIPLAHTTSPPQLEDTMAHLASFVSSGAIQRVQNTIIGVNRVMPQGNGAVHRLASQTAADLADLSNNIDVVDQLLNRVHETTEVLNNRIPTIDYVFSPRGMTGLDRSTQGASYIATIFPSVGTIFNGGFWLTPLLTSLADSAGALQQSKWAFEHEWPAWRKLFTDTFLPQDKYPAINITSIAGPDGRELSGNVAEVLRIIGAAR